MAKGKGPAVRCELRVLLPSGRFFLFACLFLFDHADDDRCDDRDQHEANQDGADIIGDPIPHMIISCQI
jgi:hypothetical protein